MSLTDEQIDALDCVSLNQSDWNEFEVFKPSVRDFARAIESAATAPLLERIKELERDEQADQAEIERLERGIEFLTAQAEAACEALEALRKDAGWRAIETAPKDGTAVLVSEGRFCYCVEWNEEFDWWAVDDNKLGPFRLRGQAPTHWKPLPPPPDAAKEQG